jgi:hypothetical protein
VRENVRQLGVVTLNLVQHTAEKNRTFSRAAWRRPLEGDWPADLGVRRIGAAAGDCLLFTAKMKHATIGPWTSKTQERRTVFNKYVLFGLHHNGEREIKIETAELHVLLFWTMLK